MDDHLDQLRLDDIERRVQAVTAGPWTMRWLGAISGLAGAFDADRQFIIHARDDVEFLLNLVSLLRGGSHAT